MRKAARAIIIENGKILVMHRTKYDSKYYTLVGGRSAAEENLEQTLVREIKEETGLTVTHATLMFIEEHPEPYNEQYVYLCNVAAHGDVKIQDSSEEGHMNAHGANVHAPFWIETKAFATLPFRTPQLQTAIVHALKKGWPKEPIKL